MKRMLFNATQQEELRVAIVDGKKLIDIDTEGAGKQQKKGNIYKAVITRIEPALEACFVDYGEERHGFLPFKEINRTYLQKAVDFRHERIQDGLVEGQSLIVQVDKEQRGNKGACLTTFISLAGRYLVLMPNNPRGGGISRRIDAQEREELREQMEQLEVPKGMSMIGRTAGIGRNLQELQWDLNYLIKLWRAIDQAVQDNAAPLLIYLESSLVIRAIRDYFHPDITEILVDTEEVYEQAHTFMSVVMPENLPRIKMYEDSVPIFSRFQIEKQIQSAHDRSITLPSGGVLVIDHTEALVAIDVNSARATSGADIEETALTTNLEAAEEVASQLRLRDIGGLVVIDFIDMLDPRHQRDVENKIRDAIVHDRARVQLGKISKFGLLELSRQRLRPALAESYHMACVRCNGTGHIPGFEASALQVLRIIEEEALKSDAQDVQCQVPIEVASYLLNEKRKEVQKIEGRCNIDILILPNKYLQTPAYKITRQKNKTDEMRPSYGLIEALEDPNSPAITPKTEQLKPKAKAVVGQILPDTPMPAKIEAPIQLDEIKKGAPSVLRLSLWQRWKNWWQSLFGQPLDAHKTMRVPATDNATSPAENQHRGRRGGGHHKHQDGQRRNRGRHSSTHTRSDVDGERTAAPASRESRDNREKNTSQDGARTHRKSPQKATSGMQNDVSTELDNLPPHIQDALRHKDGSGTDRKPREARSSREAREPREPRETRENKEGKENADFNRDDAPSGNGRRTRQNLRHTKPESDDTSVEALNLDQAMLAPSPTGMRSWEATQRMNQMQAMSDVTAPAIQEEEVVAAPRQNRRKPRHTPSNTREALDELLGNHDRTREASDNSTFERVPQRSAHHQHRDRDADMNDVNDGNVAADVLVKQPQWELMAAQFTYRDDNTSKDAHALVGDTHQDTHAQQQNDVLRIQPLSGITPFTLDAAQKQQLHTMLVTHGKNWVETQPELLRQTMQTMQAKTLQNKLAIKLIQRPKAPVLADGPMFLVQKGGAVPLVQALASFQQ